MPYLLHEDPMALPAPTNHPRMKCEKTQINNSFESILDEDVPYLILVKNTAEEAMDICSKRFQYIFLCFLYIIYIQFGVSVKA